MTKYVTIAKLYKNGDCVSTLPVAKNAVGQLVRTALAQGLRTTVEVKQIIG